MFKELTAWLGMVPDFIYLYTYEWCVYLCKDYNKYTHLYLREAVISPLGGGKDPLKEGVKDPGVHCIH